MKQRNGTERYYYLVITKEEKKRYIEHLDDALDAYEREGVKMYLVTKDLYPTKALAMWR